MNALKVLNRLNSSGFQAYLVGGSVRDLLLNKRPKDFDVALLVADLNSHTFFFVVKSLKSPHLEAVMTPKMTIKSQMKEG